MPLHSADSNSLKELSTKYEKYEDFTYIEGLWITNKWKYMFNMCINLNFTPSLYQNIKILKY